MNLIMQFQFTYASKCLKKITQIKIVLILITRLVSSDGFFTINKFYNLQFFVFSQACIFVFSSGIFRLALAPLALTQRGVGVDPIYCKQSPDATYKTMTVTKPKNNFRQF